MRELLTNSGYILIDRLATSAMIFLNLIIMIKFYSAEQVGVYQYSIALVAIFGLVMTFVDEKVVKTYFINVDMGKLVNDAIKLKACLLVITYTLIFLFHTIDLLTTEEFLIITILITGSCLKDVFAPYYFALDYFHKSEKRAIASIFGGFTAFIIQIIFIFNATSLTLVASAQVVGAAIFIIVLKRFYNKEVRQNHEVGLVNHNKQKEIIKSSIPVAISAAAQIIYMRISIIMIENIMGFEEVAIYALSTQIISIIIIGVYPIQVSFYPNMVNLYTKNRVNFNCTYTKLSRSICSIAIIWCGTAFLISSVVVANFLPNEYSQINEFLFLHFFTSVFCYNVVLRSSYLTLSKKTKYLLYSQIIALAISLLLNSFFIPIFGLSGAALATCVTTFISLILMNAFFKDTRWLFFAHVKAFVPIWRIKKINL